MPHSPFKFDFIKSYNSHSTNSIQPIVNIIEKNKTIQITVHNTVHTTRTARCMILKPQTLDR